MLYAKEKNSKRKNVRAKYKNVLHERRHTVRKKNQFKCKFNNYLNIFAMNLQLQCTRDDECARTLRIEVVCSQFYSFSDWKWIKIFAMLNRAQAFRIFIASLCVRVFFSRCRKFVHLKIFFYNFSLLVFLRSRLFHDWHTIWPFWLYADSFLRLSIFEKGNSSLQQSDFAFKECRLFCKAFNVSVFFFC